MGEAAEGFGIGVLAARAGVTPGVLRTWENRYGFPAGQRSPAGHRRFTDADVDQLRRVLEARDAGLPLRLAIDSVTRRDAVAERSAFAAASTAVPGVRPARIGRRALVAASHAVEDESLARGDEAVVLGSFQLGHRYQPSRHRWEELARTAAWSAVVADFEDDEVDLAASPARCPLPDGSPLRREWTVVCLGPSYAAVVAAWERPSLPGARAGLRGRHQHPPRRRGRGRTRAGRRRDGGRRGPAPHRRTPGRARGRHPGHLLARRRPHLAARARGARPDEVSPGRQPAPGQWFLSASISSSLLIEERPSMSSSAARSRSSSTVRSS